MSEWIKADVGTLKVVHPEAIYEVRWGRACYRAISYGKDLHNMSFDEYRIVEAPREQVVVTRYYAISSGLSERGYGNRDSCLAASNLCAVAAVETVTFHDGIPVSSTFERVK